jgi:hypothetical protein
VEVANVYTITPFSQLACCNDLLVVGNGRTISFYRLQKIKGNASSEGEPGGS